MQQKALQHVIATVKQIHREDEKAKNEDVISVSETISVAVSIYETIRNTLEYDEEHLLRRNAIRRILKRRLGEMDSHHLATKLIRELIWARYLPNHTISSSMIEIVGNLFDKYKILFEGLNGETHDEQNQYNWLLDVLSTEIEYVIGPPCIDEALASYAYQALKDRVKWQSKLITPADQDLQLYIAVHRTVLKSNEATLRYRILTLYYPSWRTAKAGDHIVKEIAMHFRKVYSSVEEQINHQCSDVMYRFVRKHAVVFHLISDVVQDNADAFAKAIAGKDTDSLDRAILAALADRYRVFRSRLIRTVFRAAFFLLLTKSILAVLVEYPYELFVLKSTDYFPLAVNILFPPFLLAFLGLTVRISKKKNNARILEEVHALFGTGDDFSVVFKQKTPWNTGVLWIFFNGLYLVAFVGVIYLIVLGLQIISFNNISIAFFIFFLSLVAYFGVRIRNIQRELILVESANSFLLVIGDILFLPIVRAGRWVAMRAPRINIFLFFFDFIIEAPFKAAVEIIENWFAFLREKREEIL